MGLAFQIEPLPSWRLPLGESRLEELGISVRACNALRGAGCRTILDVMELDLSKRIRGLGKKTKEDIFAKLAEAGFPHRSKTENASDIASLNRSLVRIEERVESTLATLSKDLRAVRARLQRLKSAELAVLERDRATDGGFSR